MTKYFVVNRNKTPLYKVATAITGANAGSQIVTQHQFFYNKGKKIAVVTDITNPNIYQIVVLQGTPVRMVRQAGSIIWIKASDVSDVTASNSSSSADGAEKPLAATPAPAAVAHKEWLTKGMMLGLLLGTGVGLSIGAMIGGKYQILMLGSIGLVAGSAIGYGGKQLIKS